MLINTNIGKTAEEIDLCLVHFYVVEPMQSIAEEATEQCLVGTVYLEPLFDLRWEPSKDITNILALLVDRVYQGISEVLC